MTIRSPLLAGAASREITPPAGLAMTGFAARSEPALGAHDPLTARALALGETAVVILDLIGLTQASARRIAEASGLAPERVVVQATHTHGGPASMEGRLWTPPDPAWLAFAEAQAAAALREAWEKRRPARLFLAEARNARIGRNRRRAEAPTDPTLTLLRVEAEEGRPIALLAGYACHPVVLGADNRLWTADYPHFLRRALERAFPGALALFATGFAGDVNTGHSAAASLALEPQPERSFARAEEIGEELARDLLAAPMRPLGDRTAAASAWVSGGFLRRPAESDLPALKALWRAELENAAPVRAALLRIWLDWAERDALKPLEPLALPVTVLFWGGLILAALPGEIFAAAALDLRARLAPHPALLLGFAGDNPGYVPPETEFAYGGYEVEEAHRFYGRPAAFAPGLSEALVETAAALARKLTEAPSQAASAEIHNQNR